MPIIEIKSLSHPGVEIFSSLTEAQLRNRPEASKGTFIAESPKVIHVALDAGYEPLAFLCEQKHINGDATSLVEREVCREARRIVVIDGVSDTTNIGAIFRSAALGIDAVLRKNCTHFCS